MFVLAIQTGLRIGKLTGLTVGDVELGCGAHIHCVGKGCNPLLLPTTVAVHRGYDVGNI